MATLSPLLRRLPASAPAPAGVHAALRAASTLSVTASRSRSNGIPRSGGLHSHLGGASAKRHFGRTTAALGAPTFERIAPAPDPNHGVPLPRSSHGIAAVATDDGTTRLVVYGGENTPRTPIDRPGQQLWIAEESGGRWKWVSPPAASDSDPPPTPRLGHSVASVGKHAYVFGGRGGVSESETANGELYKLEVIHSPTWPFCPDYTAKWTKIDGSAGPEARSFQSMVSVGTDLYLFGGCGANGRLSDLWRFNTRFEHWTKCGESRLRGRGGPCLFALEGGKIAVVAGFAGEETNDAHVYDPESGEWDDELTTVEGLRPRSVCAFGTLDSRRSYLFGGEVSPSDLEHEGAGGFEDDLLVFDARGEIESVHRSSGESWPGARGWSASVPEGEGFYVFGGLAGDDRRPERLGDLWRCKLE